MSIVSEKEIADDLSAQIDSMIPKRMSRKKLLELSSRISALSSQRLKSKLRKQLKQVYNRQIEIVSNDLGVDIGFGKVDENLIETVMRNRKLDTALKRINSLASKKAQEIVEQGLMRGKSLSEISSKLMEVVKVTDSRAERIARTESQRVQTLARETSYSKIIDPDDAAFKWIGPNDNRTTQICKNIRRRTRGGVSMKRLKQIVKQEADPEFYSPGSPFSPHFNCRHIFIRKR